MATVTIVHALMTDEEWVCKHPRGMLVPRASEIDLDGVTCDGCVRGVALTLVVSAP